MKLANNNEQKVIECSEDVDFNQDEEWEVCKILIGVIFSNKK